MKNNRGQALVEFIIILPIFLMLIISVIDLGNIISKKYSLENDIDVISNMYNTGDFDGINTYVKRKKLKLNYDNNDDLININLSKNINIISPVLNLIFGKTYEINVEKSIYSE